MKNTDETDESFATYCWVRVGL